MKYSGIYKTNAPTTMKLGIHMALFTSIKILTFDYHGNIWQEILVSRATKLKIIKWPADFQNMSKKDITHKVVAIYSCNLAYIVVTCLTVVSLVIIGNHGNHFWCEILVAMVTKVHMLLKRPGTV